MFKENQTVLGSVAIVNGQAVLEKTDFTAGVHTVTAEYQGDGNFVTAMSNESFVQVVVPDVELKLLAPPTIAPAGGNAVYTLEFQTMERRMSQSIECGLICLQV